MARMLSCLRALLLGFIVILGFSGVITCGGSIYFLYLLHEFPLLTPSGVDGPPLSLLGIGLLTIALAWFVWHFDYSSKSQIISIASLVLIVAVIEMSIGIWAVVRHEQFELPEKLIHEATKSLNDFTRINYGKPSNAPETEWDQMHKKLSCCGVYGADQDFRQKRINVPWSCCSKNDDKNICEKGCIHPMMSRTPSIFLFIFILALCSVIIKAFIIAMAWCYAKAIKESMEKRKQMMMSNKTSAIAAAAAAAAASRPNFDEYTANLSPLVEKARRPPKF